MKLLHCESSFFQRHRELDLELFLEIKRTRRCACGGRLDTGNYKRKLRGVPRAAEDADRFSLCCRNRECRKRLTPPSLRFMGRKVYAAIIVVMAMDFQKSLGLADPISRRTLSRWRSFWKDRLAESSQLIRQALALGILPIPQPGQTPNALLVAFGFPEEEEGWTRALKFFTQFRADPA